MKGFRFSFRNLFIGDPQADRVVPPTGHTAYLTVFSAAVMGFLAVFALALSLAAGRLAERWSDNLAQTSTIRIAAPPGQQEAQTQATMDVLKTTLGIQEARVLSQEDQYALLEPWFGKGFDLGSLPIPQLIEIVEKPGEFDPEGLRLRLRAEVPSAFFDDHGRWRAPLLNSAKRLRLLGWFSIGLIFLAVAAVVTLAANASLSANAKIIEVLRLVGATDQYIAQAFIRRFTTRAFLGACAGTLCGLVAVFLMPASGIEDNILTGIRFQGWGWLIPISIPLMSGAVALFATRLASKKALEALS